MSLYETSVSLWLVLDFMVLRNMAYKKEDVGKRLGQKNYKNGRVIYYDWK